MTTPNPHTTEKCCEKCWITEMAISGRNEYIPVNPPFCCNDTCPCHTQEPDNEWDARAEAGEIPFAPQQEGWEVAVKKLWEKHHYLKAQNRVGYIHLFNDFEELLRTELAGQRERIAGEIEKMKARETDCQHTPNDSCDSDCAYQQFNRGWNDALLRSASIARATE